MLTSISSIPSTDIQIDDSIYPQIADLAVQLQQHYATESGETYDVRDLQQVVLKWLGRSIESLVEDGMFHLIEGNRSFAFNRSEFDRQINKLQPLEAEQTPTAA